MVKWNAIVQSELLGRNEEYEGQIDDGSWLKFPEVLRKGDMKIISLQLLGDSGGGKIDSNADGYFIGNKVIALMPSTVQIELVGIGYWKKHESVARIKWYNKHTMELMYTEARNLNECGFCLIKN